MAGSSENFASRDVLRCLTRAEIPRLYRGSAEKGDELAAQWHPAVTSRQLYAEYQAGGYSKRGCGARERAATGLRAARNHGRLQVQCGTPPSSI